MKAIARLRQLANDLTAHSEQHGREGQGSSYAADTAYGLLALRWSSIHKANDWNTSALET